MTSTATTPLVTDPRTRLRTRTVLSADEEALLERLPAGRAARDACSWVRGGEGLVGWGRAAHVATTGPNRFADARDWWRRLVADADVSDDVGLPGCGPVAFGSFAYAAGSPAGGTLVVPSVVLGHRGGVWWISHQEIVGGDPAATTGTTDAAVAAGRTDTSHPDLGLSTDPPAARNAPPARPTRSPVDPPTCEAPTSATESCPRVTIADGARTASAWQDAVRAAVARIAAGEVDKVVLARDLEVTCEAPVDPVRLARRLAESYDRTWVFAVDGLVGATPEMLVRLERGLATSRVLAGTIRRTGDDSHDLALAASLARSSKDLEEHEYAVRSVVEALAPHCTSTTVPETPFVLHLPNVMHLATDVAGRMRGEADSLELAAALHPSAAVCGTPRQAADAVITELEGMDRGRYAGPVGWLDAAGDGEWGIALRSGAIDPDDPTRMRLFAGCGIVVGSDAAAELAESEAKFVPMRGALTGG